MSSLFCTFLLFHNRGHMYPHLFVKFPFAVYNNKLYSTEYCIPQCNALEAEREKHTHRYWGSSEGPPQHSTAASHYCPLMSRWGSAAWSLSIDKLILCQIRAKAHQDIQEERYLQEKWRKVERLRQTKKESYKVCLPQEVELLSPCRDKCSHPAVTLHVFVRVSLQPPWRRTQALRPEYTETR